MDTPQSKKYEQEFSEKNSIFQYARKKLVYHKIHEKQSYRTEREKENKTWREIKEIAKRKIDELSTKGY